MPARWRIDLGAACVFLALGAMFAAVPRYVVEELDGSRAVAGFAVSIFFAAAVVTRPLAGRFIDRRGRRLLLATLPFVLAGAILALALADGVAAVLALRFLQGTAGGAFYVVAVTAETDLAPPQRRASAIARLSIAIYVGFAAGPMLGERLLDASIGGTWAVLALLAGAGGLLTATVGETRVAPAAASGHPGGATPRVPWLHPTSVLPGFTLLSLGVGYTAITGLSALYAREIGLGSSDLLFATFALTILVLRLGSGRLADAVGPTRVMFPGLASYVVGFAVLAALPSPAPAAIGVALVGAGWAVVFPAATSWVAGRVPDAERGAALGTLIAFMDIGQGAGGYVVGAVADHAGFGWAYAVPATLAVLGAAVLAVAVARAAPPVRAAP